MPPAAFPRRFSRRGGRSGVVGFEGTASLVVESCRTFPGTSQRRSDDSSSPHGEVGRTFGLSRIASSAYQEITHWELVTFADRLQPSKPVFLLIERLRIG